MSPEISWVFFDVGNVVFTDDLAMLFIYQTLHPEILRIDSSITFGEILRQKEELVRRNGDGKPHQALAVKYLGEEGYARFRQAVLAELDRDYARYNTPIPGVREVMGQLSGRFKIGVAANQVKACRQALGEAGLLDHLSLVWLSEEVGLSKPDRRFFEGFLEEAGCSGAEAVMIGDRLDYDILPAKAQGMKTILTRMDYRNMVEVPPTEEARWYFESLARVRVSGAEPRTEGERPDAVVTLLEQIPSVIDELGIE